MYNKHFGLEELPFSIAPDPRYLYMSEQHREALAHLIYGFNSDGGFVLLTGEVGTGKTTVCRCLLEQIQENAAIAFILNPKLTVEELLGTVCDEFGIQYPEGNTSIKLFVDKINAFLLDANSKGRKAVLIIDEAQNLSSDVLEQLRLLTNLETNQNKLLQIILLGQPELRDKLSQLELRQLSQRIIARYHLGPLSRKDIGAYVEHRLAVAGLRDQLFSDSTISKLFSLSKGVPRLINVLCDRALLGTYTQGKKSVNTSTLKKAANEVFGNKGGNGIQSKTYVWVLALFIFAIVGVVLAATYYQDTEHEKLEVDTAIETSVTDDTQDIEKTVAVETVTEPGNLEWTVSQTIDKSREIAYQELFKQWDIMYNPVDNIPACEYAMSQGLLCNHKQGNLRSIALINRPAILKLYKDNGQYYYITLTALKGETAKIIIGSEQRETSVADIESKWLGDYTILWKPPMDYKGDIRPGKQDPAIQWVEDQLAVIQNRTVRTIEELQFDNTLVEQVKQFQLVEGLVPDGIIGTHTFIHINTAVTAGIPGLTAAKKNE